MVEFVSSCKAGWRRPVEVVDGVACVRLFDGTPYPIKKMRSGYFVRVDSFVFTGSLRVKAVGRVVKPIGPDRSVTINTRKPNEIMALYKSVAKVSPYIINGHEYYVTYLNVTSGELCGVACADAVLTLADCYVYP